MPRALVLAALAAAPLFLSAPATAADPTRVRLETSLGDVVIALEDEAAPKTVANFLHYVRSGLYDGTIFHRVIPNFMIQAGGYGADRRRRATRDPIENESANGLRNARGTVAMARTADPHSATSQFFINVVDNGFLDRDAAADGWGYAVFGRVVEGMDVVDRIRAVETTTVGRMRDVPRQDVVIVRARVVGAGAAGTDHQDKE